MAITKCPLGGPLKILGGYAAKTPPQAIGHWGEHRAVLGGARGIREVPCHRGIIKPFWCYNHKHMAIMKCP